MTNRAQIREFYKKVLFFKPDFSNLGVNWRYVSHDKIQNFSSINLKLCLLGQKKQRHGL